MAWVITGGLVLLQLSVGVVVDSFQLLLHAEEAPHHPAQQELLTALGLVRRARPAPRDAAPSAPWGVCPTALRRGCWRLLHSRYVEPFVVGVVLLNTAAAAVDVHLPAAQHAWLEHIVLLCTAIYVAEAAVEVAARTRCGDTSRMCRYLVITPTRWWHARCGDTSLTAGAPSIARSVPCLLWRCLLWRCLLWRCLLWRCLLWRCLLWRCLLWRCLLWRCLLWRCLLWRCLLWRCLLWRAFNCAVCRPTPWVEGCNLMGWALPRLQPCVLEAATL